MVTIQLLFSCSLDIFEQHLSQLLITVANSMLLLIIHFQEINLTLILIYYHALIHTGSLLLIPLKPLSTQSLTLRNLNALGGHFQNATYWLRMHQRGLKQPCLC